MTKVPFAPIMHVRTSSKASVQELLNHAKRRGLTPTTRLVEYAAFMVSGHIKLKPMIVPNFHFYDHAEFLAQVEQAVAAALAGNDAAVAAAAAWWGARCSASVRVRCRGGGRGACPSLYIDRRDVTGTATPCHAVVTQLVAYNANFRYT